MNVALTVASIVVVATFVAGCGGADEELLHGERQEVAETLEGFAEALGNGNTTMLDSYWSRACTAEDRAASKQAAMVLRSLFGVASGADYALTLDVAKLAIEVVSDERVTVPLEQPAGAVSATLTFNGQEAPFLGDPLVFEVPLRLVEEDGAWKVESCVLFVEEEGEEEEPLG